jgi:hypothetical protein
MRSRPFRVSEHETALEVGWLLAELERRFDYGLDELARRFDRSVSRVSGRLALVEVLPEAIQQLVREGKILAQMAMKFLVPVARQSLEDCQRMAAIFGEHHCDTRQAGQLYGAWRKGSPAIRKRILDDPELFFKTQRQAQEKAPAGMGAELLRDLEMVVAIVNRAQRRLAGDAAAELDERQSKAARHQIERIQNQLRRMDEEILLEKKPHVEPSATHHDSGTACAAREQTGDRAGDGDLPRGRAQSPALELHHRAGTESSPESRTAPATDPGAFRAVQRLRLKPLPAWIPEVYRLHQRLVDIEGYVALNSNRYSVPVEWIGRRVEVRETKDKIEIQLDARRLVTHRRIAEAEHQRVMLAEHRPPRGQRDARPDPHPEEKAIVTAAPELAEYVAGLKQRSRKVVTLALRQLLRLVREYPREPLLGAVREAGRYGLYDLDRLERMILRRVTREYFLLEGESGDD